MDSQIKLAVNGISNHVWGMINPVGDSEATEDTSPITEPYTMVGAWQMNIGGAHVVPYRWPMKAGESACAGFMQPGRMYDCWQIRIVFLGRKDDDYELDILGTMGRLEKNLRYVAEKEMVFGEIMRLKSDLGEVVIDAMTLDKADNLPPGALFSVLLQMWKPVDDVQYG